MSIEGGGGDGSHELKGEQQALGRMCSLYAYVECFLSRVRDD
jgi:hypothetical protein